MNEFGITRQHIISALQITHCDVRAMVRASQCPTDVAMVSRLFSKKLEYFLARILNRPGNIVTPASSDSEPDLTFESLRWITLELKVATGEKWWTNAVSKRRTGWHLLVQRDGSRFFAALAYLTEDMWTKQAANYNAVFFEPKGSDMEILVGNLAELEDLDCEFPPTLPPKYNPDSLFDDED